MLSFSVGSVTVPGLARAWAATADIDACAALLGEAFVTLSESFN